MVTIHGAAVTGAIVISATAVEDLPEEYDVTLPTDVNLTVTGATTATEGENYTATLAAKEGYLLPETITVTIGGVAYTGYTYNSTTGAITIPAACVTGAIVISATAVEIPPTIYNVTLPTDANLEVTGATTATESEDYTVTITAKEGSAVSGEIIVEIGGVKYTGFTYNAETGVLTIPAAAVTGNIKITAVSEGIEPPIVPTEFDVTLSEDSHVTISEDKAIDSFEFEAILLPDEGYTLPETITVTIDGTECTDFTYNSETGELVIPGDCVVGDIVITVSAVPETPTEPEDEKLFIVGTLTGWEFVEMVESEATEGEYSYLISGKKGEKVKFKFTFTDAWEDEISAIGGGDFELVLPDDGTIMVYVNTNMLGEGSANGDYVRYECELSIGDAGSTAVSTGVLVHAGDATPYVATAIIAILALGAFVLLASKKRRITE